MLPSICAPSTVLLLVYLVGVASSTEGGGSNQMLQPASLLELTVEESGLSTREAINMTLFMWLYNMTANVTYLTICTQESLIKKYENITAGPILLFYQLVGAGETNIEGQVLEGNSSCCSLFTMNGTVPLAINETTYGLHLIVTNGKSTIYRSGNISFGMPVETSILSCRNESYTRAAGLPSGITFDFPSTCINDTHRLSDDVVCYLEGEFSHSYLCYTTNDPPGLQVCLQGSSLNTMNEVYGQLTISYLAYESVPDTAGAHLSLEFEGQEPTYGMEAIIWKDKMLATSCLNTSCSIPAFTPGFVHYDVCAVIVVDGLVNKTSTDTITDLDAVAFSYSGSQLLQFGYTNANPERYYSAYVVNVTIDSPWDVVDNATVDCSAVPLNTTCHGYFEADCSGDLMVAVEYYSDPEINNKGNKIIFPCQSMTETRR